MNWLQENSATLLMVVAVLMFVMRGPVLARLVGVEPLSVHDLAKRLASATPPLLLDVRSRPEFEAGHLPQALLVPLPELRQHMDALRQRPDIGTVAVICQSGNRSLHGSVLLKRAGFVQVFNVVGGMNNWKVQGYPVRGRS
ncbi:MAG: rhodanese-like domain-containing protein [Magnetococcus sp. MYC-9]